MKQHVMAMEMTESIQIRWDPESHRGVVRVPLWG